jgi:micrococcal nuclease
MVSPRLLTTLLVASVVLNSVLLLNHSTATSPQNKNTATSTADSRDAYYTSSTTYPLLRIVDGDTLIIGVGSDAEYVRMIGLNTPEPNSPGRPECYARAATQKLRDLVEHKGMVTLYFDPSQSRRDTYGRLFAYVELLDGTDLSERMIREGYGKEYMHNLPYERQARYKQAEAEAVRTAAGLWAPDACPI